MSPARSASASRSTGGGGRAAITALIVVGVAVGMLLLIRTRPKVQAFDPRSSNADGANGVVLLLEHYGATVDITSSAPQPGANERVFVIADRLSASQRAKLLDFVAGGGIAVVADPHSSLHGGVSADGVKVEGSPVGAFDGGRLDAADEANVERGDCTIGSLQSLRGVFTPAGVLFPTTGDQPHCFSQGSDSFVIVAHHGSGLVVGFGDNRIVTNEYLRYADNAGLVSSLLAPATGEHVRIMIGTGAVPSAQDIGKGNETLLDLVRPGIWMALAQLAIAFVVFCIARGVRPGRAVREPQPTQIAGNELVLATGNLMQRAQHFQRAGWLIRSEFYRQLCAYFRMPPDTSIERVGDIVYRRTGVDAREVRAALQTDVSTSVQLTQLSSMIDRVRHLTISPAPPSAATTDAPPIQELV